MVKSVIKFSVIRLVLAAVNFFTLGALIGFFLTEGKVYTSLIAVYMIFNILLFSLVWAFILNIPPRKSGSSDRFDLLVLHIPTLIYLLLTLGLLAANLILKAVEPGAGGFYVMDMIRYFYQAICPLGINTMLMVCVTDSIDSYAYDLSNFLNLALYAVVITVIYKRARKKEEKALNRGNGSRRADT